MSARRIRMTSGHGESEDVVLASDYDALVEQIETLRSRIAELERQRSELLTLRDIEFLGEKCQKCAALEPFILWCIEKMKELEDARA